MTCKELIDYLGRFDPDERVGVVVVDLKRRLHHITHGYDLVEELPAILLETNESEPMDAIMEEAEDQCGS